MSNRARAVSFAERLQVPSALEFPTEHLGLKWADLSASDVDEAMALYERCKAYDRSDAVLTADRVRNYVDSAGTDDRHHAIVGWDSHGTMRAFGVVTALGGCETLLQTQVRAFIDPTWRGRGIGRALLDWQDGRARQLLADDGRDLPVSMEARVDAHNTERRRLLAAAGFTPSRTIEEYVRTVRTDTHVNSVIKAKIAEAGVSIVPFDPDLTDDIRTVYNRSSAETAGGRSATEIDFSRRATDIDPDMSFLALTQSETPLVIGFLLAGRRYGGEGAWIEFLGTERAWRSQGIVDALLAHHLDACVEAGLKLSSTEIDMQRSPGMAAWLNGWDYFSTTTDTVYAIEL